ncbi:hypothetical protein H6G54_09745 [Anabaena cylindrica FACHB-243]|uniref:hypothetical protein n=1 Tax=Anabaena TaxID=1163 RepID=UPI0002EBD4BC|nr:MULTISPECIES: hypothetical protein [Anabaena]MBD2417987.1 hypothetical protein [Anabaena cylindrica FACHB-243]MBY5282671.1 hypothetical protein [Anabaena sp. CCAP 1446/1C]MBY5307547.1 hypothetical protein [Anabaena sp. CCAP 1446/1C]MCM2404904.1 hypothetical protein [Anabaena sp. CCAP 1446/1C]
MTSPVQWVSLASVKTQLASSQRPEAAPDALRKRNLNGGHYIFSMQLNTWMALFWCNTFNIVLIS